MTLSKEESTLEMEKKWIFWEIRDIAVLRKKDF